jgi:prepilin-type processing-associated H-X9-DG protein
MLEPSERADHPNIIAVPPLPSRREPPPMRRQLRIGHLFVGIGVTAAILAIGTQFGAMGFVLAVLAGTASIALALVWWFRRGWVALIPLGLLFILGLIPAIDVAPSPTRQRQQRCANNLKHLTLALHNYHQDQGSFPPAYVTDADGKPLYSWRVLILPYVEEGLLYEQFHLNEPWDSPHNLKLAQRMPTMFGCPVQRRTTTTNYVAITGDKTMWPGAKAVTFDDVTDDHRETLLLVEWCESDIFWTAPRDLPMEDVRGLWQPTIPPQPSDRHQGKVNIAFADGHIRAVIPERISPSDLRSILTRAGRDPLPIKAKDLGQ